METDWNKLIELYLSGELSTDGKEAFEKELVYNSELQDELFVHRSIQQASKRAYQRELVLKAGANYFYYKKIKIATSILIAVIIGIGLFWLFLHQQNENTGEQGFVSKMNSTELVAQTTQKHEVESISEKAIIEKDTISSETGEIRNFHALENQTTISIVENTLKSGLFISPQIKEEQLLGLTFANEKKDSTIAESRVVSTASATNEKEKPIELFFSNNAFYTVNQLNELIPFEIGNIDLKNVKIDTLDKENPVMDVGDLSTQSILKKSAKSVAINSTIAVPKGCFLIISQKKNDPVLVRNKYDNTDQIQEIGGMNFPNKKLTHKKAPDGLYYYCLPEGEYLFNQQLFIKNSSLDTLRTNDTISGVIEYQIISDKNQLIPVKKEFKSIIGTKLKDDKIIDRKRRKTNEQK